MPRSAADRRPLPTVLAEIALVAPGIVLQRGQDYMRIENAAREARRDAASGPQQVRDFLSASEFYWNFGPEKRIVIYRVTPHGDIPYAAEPGTYASSPDLGRVSHCREGIQFGRKCYVPGQVYPFEELPAVAKEDARSQRDDLEFIHGRAPEELLYNFDVMPHQALLEMLQAKYGPDWKKAAAAPKIRKIARSIEKNGLESPPLVDEGWDRALALASLGLDMPYFDVPPSVSFQFIPTIGRRGGKP